MSARRQTSWLPMLAFVFAATSEPATARAEEAPPSPLARYASGAAVTIDGRSHALPPVDLRAWTATRAAAGLGDTCLACRDQTFAERRSALMMLHEEGYIGAERALLRVAEATGDISADRVRIWDAVLGRVTMEGLSPDTAALLLWTVLFDDGSASALLEPRCLPTGREGILALEALAAIEQSVPPYRAESTFDEAASLPAATAWPSDPPATGAFAASLAGIAWARPSVAAEASAARAPLALDPETCSPAAADYLSSVASAAVDPWWTAPATEALYATTDVPNALTRRIAVVRYLSTDGTTLAAMSRGLLVRRGPHSEEVQLTTALAAGARNAPADMAAALERMPLASGVYAKWVRAEAARLGGEAREAVELAGECTATDPWFTAAVFSHAAALFARRQDDEALADLQHLRTTLPPGDVYAYWMRRLEARLNRIESEN